MSIKVSPSILSADFANLEKDCQMVIDAGADMLHIDVMDGSFAPNFALGVDFARQLKKNCSIPLDIHLMVREPEKHIPSFPIAEGEIVSVHIESTDKPRECIEAIKSRGARAFIVLNPETPTSALSELLPLIDGGLIMAVNPGFAGQKMLPGTIEKIAEIRRLLDEAGREDAEIEVDGNVSIENGIRMRGAGANIFVLGTAALFRGDLEANIHAFRDEVFGS